MLNTNELTPEMLEKIRNDIGYALGILVGLKTVEPSHMQYGMEEARNALLRAVNTLPKENK